MKATEPELALIDIIKETFRYMIAVDPQIKYEISNKEKNEKHSSSG
jgi:hypothetical protein